MIILQFLLFIQIINLSFFFFAFYNSFEIVIVFALMVHALDILLIVHVPKVKVRTYNTNNSFYLLMLFPSILNAHDIFYNKYSNSYIITVCPISNDLLKKRIMYYVAFQISGSLQRSRTRRGQEMAPTNPRNPHGRERKRGESRTNWKT